MAPCLDPATEMQAAGRIHRLGQTRDVLVKKFAFRNSIDEQIVELHAKICVSSKFSTRLKVDVKYVNLPCAIRIIDGFFAKAVSNELLAK